MVEMRIRPVLTGKDADRFIQRTRKNDISLKRYSYKKIKEYRQRLMEFEEDEVDCYLASIEVLGNIEEIRGSLQT